MSQQLFAAHICQHFFFFFFKLIANLVEQLVASAIQKLQETAPEAFRGRGGIFMVVAVAVFSSLATPVETKKGQTSPRRA